MLHWREWLQISGPPGQAESADTCSGLQVYSETLSDLINIWSLCSDEDNVKKQPKSNPNYQSSTNSSNKSTGSSTKKQIFPSDQQNSPKIVETHKPKVINNDLQVRDRFFKTFAKYLMNICNVRNVLLPQGLRDKHLCGVLAFVWLLTEILSRSRARALPLTPASPPQPRPRPQWTSTRPASGPSLCPRPSPGHPDPSHNLSPNITMTIT